VSLIGSSINRHRTTFYVERRKGLLFVDLRIRSQVAIIAAGYKLPLTIGKSCERSFTSFQPRLGVQDTYFSVLLMNPFVNEFTTLVKGFSYHWLLPI
jgi:hypothetical protein